MSLPHLSRRAKQTPPSPIRRLAHLAERATREGRSVYYLNIGQPDILTPPEFFEGIAQFTKKVVAYEKSQGMDLLRINWAKYIEKELSVSISPDHLLITTGASEALVFLFMTLCDPGDEILTFDPTYANFIGFAAIAGVRLVPVASYLENEFALPDSAEIVKEISPKTRAILLCSPNNPTGTVYTAAEIQRLLEICEEHNLYLVVDETYREFVYDNLKPLSVLQLAPNANRVIVVDSLSKRFSLCGARIGALITTNQEVMSTTLNIAQARLAAPTIDQFAAAYMIERIGVEYLDGVRKEYQQRRDTLLASLAKVPGISFNRPQGAFYCVARLAEGLNAEEFASFMLSDFSHEGKTTFVAPAAGFYLDDKRGFSELRIAYVLAQESIAKAIEILGEGLKAFSQRALG